MNMQEFFNLVLPQEGYYCAAIFRHGLGEPPTHCKFETKETLELHLNEHSQFNVYYACASYRNEGPERKKKYVFRIRDLWVDFDDKQFDGRSAGSGAGTMEAVHSLVSEFSLPKPLIVDSGGGLHCHWPLDRDYTIEEWQPYADALNEAAIRYGADPGITNDCARILRPVGTTNFKYDPPRPVTIIHDGDGPCGPEPFFSLLEHAQRNRRSSETSRNNGAINGTRNLQSDTDRDADAIADKCAQWNYIRTTGGSGSGEKPWRHVLQGLTHCRNGLEIAHTWSKQDDRYDAGEVDRRFASFTGGAISCDTYRKECGDRCKGCPHAVFSPEHLGDRVPYTNGHHNGASIPHARSGIIVEDAGQHFDGKTWMTWLSKDKKGEEEIKHGVVASHDLYYLGVSKADHGGTMDYFRLDKPHADPIFLQIKWGSAMIGEGHQQIRNAGVNLGSDLRPYHMWLNESRDRYEKANKAMKFHDQFGWCDEGFILGDQLFAGGQMEVCPIAADLQARAFYLGPRGDFKSWQRAIHELLQAQSKIQAVAILSSFGACLMRFLCADEGGAIIAFISRDGGRGKTTSLDIAASPWGARRGLETTVSDTTNARIGIFGLLHNLPVLCDEFTHADDNIIRQQVQLFNDGRDKSRCNVDGSVIERDRCWQTFFICTANRSVNTALMVNGGRARASRVLEFYIDGKLDVDVVRGEQLKAILAANSGHAGPMFIRDISEIDPDTLRGMLTDEANRIRVSKACFEQTEARYIVRALAAMSVAGTLLHLTGIIDVDTNDTITWAMGEMERLLEDRKTRPLRYVLTDYLNDMVQNTLVMAHEQPPGVKATITMEGKDVPKQVCVRRNLGKCPSMDRPITVLLAIKELRTWLQKEGYDYPSFVFALEKEGMVLRKDIRKYMGSGSTYHGPAVAVLELNAEKVYSEE